MVGRFLSRSVSLERELPLAMTSVLAGGLLLMLLTTYAVLLGRAERIVRERLSHALAQIGAQAETAMKDRRKLLQDAANDPAIVNALSASANGSFDATRRKAARDRLQQLVSSTSNLPIELVNADGVQVVAAGSPAPHVKRLLPSSDIALDTVVLSRLLQIDTVAGFWASAPVVIDGKIAGWVSQLRRVTGPAEIEKYLREMMSEQLRLTIHNSDGTVWAAAPGRIIDVPIRAEKTDKGIVYLQDKIGEVAAEEYPVAGTPWVMEMESPMEWIYSRPKPTLRLLSLMSLALLIAGGFASWALSRRITKPLVALTRAADEMAHGDYRPTVRVSGPRELERLSSAFNEMAARVDAAQHQLAHRADALEEANRAKGDFLAMMSHELRTPLNAIGGYAELIDMGIHGPVTDAQREALARLARSKEHLLALIENVLEFGRVNAGQSRYIFADVPLSSIVRGIDSLIGPQLRERNIDFAIRLCLPDVAVRCDPEKVRQIVLNLLSNAIKFTQQGGRVALECDSSQGRGLIRVRDNGVGIPAERLKLIFEPFVQGERALNRPYEGVGLGLAICRELSRGMGATLDVESEPGKGSVFTLTLGMASTADAPASAMPAGATSLIG